VSWAKPGMKCVWVNVAPLPGYRRDGQVPDSGTVVTIRGLVADYAGRGLHLQIVGYPNVDRGNDVGWRIARFRPLITRTQSQDVALFTPILDGLRVGEPVL
jgi:hypothetical protein